MIRISKYNPHFQIYYVSRKGKREELTYKIESVCPEVLNKINSEPLNTSVIKELLDSIIPIINSMEMLKVKPHTFNSEDYQLFNLSYIEEKCLNIISEIKGEMPLPHLQEILTDYVDSQRELDEVKIKKLKLK